MVFNILSDIVKHTHALGFIDAVKVTGHEDSVTVEAMEENRAVVLTGTLNTPIDNLQGTVGLSRMGVLAGYLGFDRFNSKDATVQIETRERGGAEVPAEVTFDSGSGHSGQYRFMAAEVAEEQIQVPPFKGAEWKVTVEPTNAGVTDLTTMNNILGSYEDSFIAKTNNGNLEFHIGSGSTDRSSITFAKNVEGTLTHAWRFPIANFLAIMKLHKSSESTRVSFSDAGALKIEVNSGIGTYTYILPARAS
tara:strand:+ start:876 stop:1622 length:747 start_codon:yes stop_codon:yes gene_type:complete